MNRLLTFIVAACGIGAGSALAQTHHPAVQEYDDVRIIFSEDNRTDTMDVYRIFLENAPKAFNVPGSPRFAIEGKDRKFYLGIGGMAKATVSYDWGSPIKSGFDFTTSAIPMHLKPGNGGLVQFSGATSNIFINFVGMPGDKNQIGAYINANFTGENYGFSLQYAYLTFRGFTAGYNYSLFSDMAAAPPSIDNEGPCGFTAIPNGVLDYKHSFNPHWSIGAGVELPIASATVSDGSTYMVNQRVPDIPAYVQYSWGGGQSWIRFSGIIRNMLYHDVIEGCNRNNVGWGIKMSGSAALTPFVTAYYQAAYGKGITSYFQDLYEGGLDMVPDSERNGKLSTVKAWGGYIGLQYNISPKVFATTTYSHLRNYAPRYNGGETPWGEQYRYAQYAVANLFWKITPVVTCGIEYDWGRRVDMDHLSRHDNRIQTMLQVSF